MLKVYLNPLALLSFAAFFALFTGCKTINRTRAEMRIPENWVLFTFDDGPNADENTTEHLLDTLKRHNIKAGFAVLGENAEVSPQILKRIYAEGHLIINHGYNAKWSLFMGKDEFIRNIKHGAQVIGGILGVNLPRLYRPHGGFYTPRQEKAVRLLGLKIACVTARSYDAVLAREEKERAVTYILNSIREQKGGIILLHDGRDAEDAIGKNKVRKPEFDRLWVVDAVEELIEIFKKESYKLNGFDPLSFFENR